jgi:hypothetical protein
MPPVCCPRAKGQVLSVWAEAGSSVRVGKRFLIDKTENICWLGRSVTQNERVDVRHPSRGWAVATVGLADVV